MSFFSTTSPQTKLSQSPFQSMAAPLFKGLPKVALPSIRPSQIYLTHGSKDDISKIANLIMSLPTPSPPLKTF